MEFPKWIKPALFGAVGGAAVLAFVGFSYGGWVTGGNAKTMADKQSSIAVATALTPYCLENARIDPNSVAMLADLKKAATYDRKNLVAKAGWATTIGAEAPNTDLAQSCQLALAANF